MTLWSGNASCERWGMKEDIAKLPPLHYLLHIPHNPHLKIITSISPARILWQSQSSQPPTPSFLHHLTIPNQRPLLLLLPISLFFTKPPRLRTLHHTLELLLLDFPRLQHQNQRLETRKCSLDMRAPGLWVETGVPIAQTLRGTEAHVCV